MRWNNHFQLEGQHAFLSASKHSWLNYDDEKLVSSYFNFLATQRGTELHAIAADLIAHKIKVKETHKTFNMYVNDAIGFRLEPEKVLFYSDNCFGTADAIRYDERNHFLRIHDLKTGVTPASMDQLYIYAGLFFLEYDIDVKSTEIELRIYQNDDILISNPGLDEIVPVMDKIISSDKIIEQIKREGEN